MATTSSSCPNASKISRPFKKADTGPRGRARCDDGRMTTTTPGTPNWVDLASPDVGRSTTFYSGLFGWDAEVQPEPEAGGYTMFRLNGKAVAGVGPIMMEGQPAAWTTYVATDDADDTTDRVTQAGGTV